MSTVDNRVVQMEFDNKAFEEKIGATLSSIDRLTESLRLSGAVEGFGAVTDAANKFDMSAMVSGATDGFDDIADAAGHFNLSSMADALDNIGSKFSALGAIGFSVISNLTNTALDFAKKTGSDFLAPVLSGGASRARNIEQAKFQFKGLGIDVEQGMASALSAVQGTAFGLDEAAKAAAQFGASGIGAGKDMTTALRAIAGSAAMTGSGFGEIAQIFTSSAGSGVVNNQDLLQFATRGLNAAAAVGKVMGKTEAQIHEMATNGDLDFKTFAAAMDKAFGEHATEANQTYAGSLGNMHAAMSRMGATFITLKDVQQRDLFNALTPAIDKVTAAIKPLIVTYTYLRQLGIDKLIDKITHLDLTNFTKAIPFISNAMMEIYLAITDPLKVIHEAFRDIFPKSTTSMFVKLAENIQDFTRKFRAGTEVLLQIKAIFRGIFAALEIVGGVVKGVFSIFKTLFDMFNKNTSSGGIVKFFVNLADKVVALNEKLIAGGGLKAFFDKLSKQIVDFMGRLGGYVNNIKKAIEYFKDGFNDFGSNSGVGFYRFVNAIGHGLHDLIENFKEFVDVLKGYIDNVRKAIEYFKDGFNDFGSNSGVGFYRFINAIGHGLHDLIEAVRYFWIGLTDMGSNEGQGLLLFANDAGNKLREFKDFVVNIFDKDIPDAVSSVEEPVNRVTQRLDALSDKFTKVWDGFSNAVGKVKDALEPVLDALKAWFADLGQKLADAMKPGDFNNVLDSVNTGLLGGIAILIAKFFKDGVKVDLTGGLFDKIKTMFDTLTEKAKAMTLQIKADVLMKIAIAIGILAASLLVLSLIDSANLTKALIAMAAGFTELILAMKQLDKIASGAGGAAKLVLLATTMNLMASSMVILGGAMLIFGTMSWEDIAKGLVAITGLLGIMIIAMNQMPGGVQMLLQANALIAISVALGIMGAAMLIFSTMSWESLAKGFVGIGIGLGLIAGAMQLMPGGVQMDLQAAGLVLIGTALNLIAASMLIFSTMSWESLAKGFVGIGAGLGIIAGAMQLMPGGIQMVAQAAGLVLIGVALGLIAAAMLVFSSMSWEELAKGLGAMGIALSILASAAMAMDGALLGAVAIGVVAISLGILVEVLKQLAKIKIADLIKGLVGIVALLAVLGIAALVLEPVIPMMLLLGAALIVIGAGFALFGLGAQAVAIAFKLIAEAGKSGIDVVMYAIDKLLEKLPEMAKSLVVALIEMATDMIDAIPALLKVLEVFLLKLLDTIIAIAPKLGETIGVLVLTILDVLRKAIPEIWALGFELLLALLTGIRDHIGEIVTLVGEIITNFLDAMTVQLPLIIDSAVALLVAFIKGISDNVNKIVVAVTDLITSFIDAISDSADRVIKAAEGLITNIVTGLGDAAGAIATAGTNAVLKFLSGLTKDIPEIGQAVITMITTIAKLIPIYTSILVNAGFRMIIDLFNGIADQFDKNSAELGKAIGHFAASLVKGIGNGVKEAIKEIIKQLFPALGGLLDVVYKVFGITSPSTVFHYIGENLMYGLRNGIVANLNHPMDALIDGSDKMVGMMSNTMSKVADVLDQEVDYNPTITPVLDLTNVRTEAQKLSGVLGTSPLLATAFSYDQARTIAEATRGDQDGNDIADRPAPAPTEIKFEQNNYSPEALSNAYIYRQTRNQIALAKEELAIL